MKIICVGENYKKNKKDNIKIFMKPDSAILKEGKPFFLPDFSNEIVAEGQMVVKICRLGKHIAQKYANRYYNAITLGVDLTAKDINDKAKEKGEPWELSKTFDNSAVIGEMIKAEETNVDKAEFELWINGDIKQKGNSEELTRKVDEIIAEVSKYMTLKIGDLIFTGATDKYNKISIGDHIEGFMDKEKVLDFYVR